MKQYNKPRMHSSAWAFWRPSPRHG